MKTSIKVALFLTVLVSACTLNVETKAPEVDTPKVVLPVIDTTVHVEAVNDSLAVDIKK